MNMNNRDRCICCGLPREIDFELIKHHVSYFPELIAHVHFSCHQEIHDGKFPYLIQYQPGDSRLFYEQQKKQTQ